MLSIFKRRSYNPTPILTSNLYNEQSFYYAFVKDLKNCKESVLIESPFLTIKRANELAPIFKKLRKHGVRVRINTRVPKHHTRSLQYEAKVAINILIKARVDVFVCKDYRHRKLAIIDNRILWEGSLNILSQSKSREIMRRTTSAELCQQMIRFTGVSKKW